jgi:hypothetical protein
MLDIEASLPGLYVTQPETSAATAQSEAILVRVRRRRIEVPIMVVSLEWFVGTTSTAGEKILFLIR